MLKMVKLYITGYLIIIAYFNWIFLIPIAFLLVFFVVAIVVVGFFVLICFVLFCFFELETTEGWFFQRVHLCVWAAAGHYLGTLSIPAQSLKSTKCEPKAG